MYVQRADDIWVNDHIMADIIGLIWRARVVISDLSGKNANVFYETGIAHTLGRDVIQITRAPADVPFDLQPLRYVHPRDGPRPATAVRHRGGQGKRFAAMPGSLRAADRGAGSDTGGRRRGIRCATHADVRHAEWAFGCASDGDAGESRGSRSEREPYMHNAGAGYM